MKTGCRSGRLTDPRLKSWSIDEIGLTLRPCPRVLPSWHTTGSGQIIGSAQLEDIFHNWYNVDIKFEFDFPEDFQEVPAEFCSFKLWRLPMNSKEIIDSLLGNKTDEAGWSPRGVGINCLVALVREAWHNKYYWGLRRPPDTTCHGIF